MFWAAIRLLLEDNPEGLAQLDAIREGFAPAMHAALEDMWARKLGLSAHDAELVNELLQLMVSSRLDYTLFFRRLSAIPEHVDALKESFYVPSSEELDGRWTQWLQRWHDRLAEGGDLQATAAAMRRANPAITWREWLIAPAYEQAAQGEYGLVRELQEVFRHPYEALPPELAATYDRLKPREFFNAGGVSHYSCSS